MPNLPQKRPNIGQQGPRRLEGEPFTGLIKRKEGMPHMLAAKPHRPAIDLCEKERNGLMDDAVSITLKVILDFPRESGDGFERLDSGFLEKLPTRGGQVVFARLDVSLGIIPMPTVIEKEKLPVMTRTSSDVVFDEHDKSGRSLVPGHSVRC